MTAGQQFPQFIIARPDPSNQRVFDEFVSQMGGAGRRGADAINNSLSGVRDSVSQALSLPRNAFGALDLNTAKLREMEQGLEAIARASREYAAASRAAAIASGETSRARAMEIRAAFEQARVEDENVVALRRKIAILDQVQAELNQTASATDAVISSSSRGAVATGAYAASMRGSRTAMVQTGQQLQDMAIQFQGGARASTIFAQQIPQLLFGLTSLEGSSNRTASRIGSMATLLSGPWSLAVVAGAAVLGTLVDKFLETDKAAEAAKLGTFAMSDAQGILANVLDVTTGKINTQNKALLALAQAQLLVARVQAQTRAAEARTGVLAIQDRPLRFTGGGLGGGFTAGRRPTDARDAISRDVLAGTLDGKAAVERLENLRRVGQITEAEFTAAATAVANLGLELENIKVFGEADALLNGRGGKGLLKPEKDRKDRKARGGDGEAKLRQLQEFGENAAEKIARINERFDEQPRLIDAAAAATRDLDAIIKDLAERKPPGFATMIAEAQAAKGTVQEALVRPFEQLREESARRLQIETLLTAGREDEAEALQVIWKLEGQIGVESEIRAKAAKLAAQGRQDEADQLNRMADLWPAERQAALDRARNVRLVNEELERGREIVSRTLAASRSVRDELVAIFAGEGSFGNIGKVFKRLQAEATVDKLFGDSFRNIDDWIKGQSGLGASIDTFTGETDRASKALDMLTSSLTGSAARIAARGAVSGAAPSAFDSAFGSIYGGASNDNTLIEQAVEGVGADIVVVGSRAEKNATVQSQTLKDIKERLDPRRVAAEMARALSGSIADALRPVLGDKFAAKVGGVLSGYFEGQFTAGTTGGVIGALKGLVDQFGEATIGRDAASTLSSHLGGALSGAQRGTEIHDLADSLGINLSRSGSQIGGALGAATGIPGGDIIGSIIGGIIGKLIGSAKRGSATLTAGSNGVDVGSTRGNSSSRIEAAEAAGGSISDALNQIAEQLGGNTDGPISVSIGVRDGNYRVDPTGQGITKTANGAIDFGKDQEAAIRYAILDAIKDGVITGISEGARRLIQGGKDLEKQIAKAIDFEGVFKRLRAIKDPVGAALDALNKEFSRLNDIFKEAGASAAQFAELEELYGIERAAAIKEAGERVTGALKALLADLTINNDALSLRDRLSAAQAAFQPLEARVRAGDTTAFDDYTQAARDLLAIQRDLSGSQPDYFRLLDEVTALTSTAVSSQDALIAAATGAASPFATASANALTEPQPVVSAISDQTGTLVAQLSDLNQSLAAQLAAANQNLGTLILQGATGTYGSIDTSGWAYGNYY